MNLTCKNHPNLRWNCKDVAWTDGKGYNGSRGLHYIGTKDYDVVPECTCPISDLIPVKESSNDKLDS